MWTLGLHIGSLHRDTDAVHRSHSNFDSAAALLHEGVVVAACRESTLAGVVRDKRFPVRAIQLCLKIAGCSLHDIDAVALDQSEAVLNAIALQRALDDAREPMRDARAWVAGMFAADFDADISSRLRFVDHNTAHMRAAFVGSGLDRATTVCFDGAGGEALAVVAEQDAAGVIVLKRIAIGFSLANLIDTISDACALGGIRAADLGFAAAGGDTARYREVMRKMHFIAPGGELYLRERAERLHMLRDVGVLQAIAQAGAADRSTIRQDLAAAAQVAIGDLVEHVLREVHRLSMCRDLCIAGEIADDPYSIGRAVHAATFERVRVAPVADDAGNAIGAAAHIACGGARTYVAPNVRWGRDLDQRDIVQRLDSWGEFVVVERLSDPAAALAQQLAQGKTVAWFHGRSEWSVRNLSSRAILNDPRQPGEGAERGFAYACRASIPKYFEFNGNTALPRHAGYCLTPRADATAVPAVLCAADGSVVLYAVDLEDKHMHNAIEEFERLTDVPYVMGRTFLGPSGTLVDSVDDAVACMFARPIDALIIGDHLVYPKRRTDAVISFLADLVPRLAPGRELSCAVPSGESAEYLIARRHETEYVVDGTPMSLPISRAMFDLLQPHGEQVRLRDGLERLSDVAAARALYEEIIACWRAGFVELRPTTYP